MARRALRWGHRCLFSALASLCLAGIAHGAALDEKGEINLGVRTYTAARIGTQNTDVTICNLVNGQTICGGSNGGGPAAARVVRKSLTFPVSPAGHLRQQRSYIEAELDHNLSRLLEEGFGPFALLNDLPFKFKKFKYHLTYRGEYEGVYDYGPAEYRTHYQYDNPILVPAFSGNFPDVGQARRRLRSVAVLRNRLFQAYLETQVSKLMMRIGRQILSWGQTDAFRLLDNINPIDNSFGGFLVPLDERRVPLDMLLANYRDRQRRSVLRGVPRSLRGDRRQRRLRSRHPRRLAVGAAQPRRPQRHHPAAAHPSRAHHPGHPRRLPLQLHRARAGDRRDGVQPRQLLDLPRHPDGAELRQPRLSRAIGPCPNGGNCPAEGFLANTVQTAPRVMISGIASTFGFPVDWARALYLSGQPIIRYELAYFYGEPRNSQQQIDPFIYAVGGCSRGRIIVTPDGQQLCTGGKRYGDSWNFVLGIDTNQFIRWLNPNQSFFITTQFFYKHLIAAAARNRVGLDRQAPQVFNGEVLPVPSLTIEPPFLHLGRLAAGARAQPGRPVPADPADLDLVLQRPGVADPDPGLRLGRRLGGPAGGHPQPRPLPLHHELQLPHRRPPVRRLRRQPAARPRQRPLPNRLRDLIT